MIEPKNRPLKCSIEQDELVIRIGIDTLAFGVAHSPEFYEYDTHKSSEGPYINITNNRLFAREIVRALQHEQEDGRTMLTDLLDEAARFAIDDGAEGVDC